MLGSKATSQKLQQTDSAFHLLRFYSVLFTCWVQKPPLKSSNKQTQLFTYPDSTAYTSQKLPATSQLLTDKKLKQTSPKSPYIYGQIKNLKSLIFVDGESKYLRVISIGCSYS